MWFLKNKIKNIILLGALNICMTSCFVNKAKIDIKCNKSYIYTYDNISGKTEKNFIKVYFDSILIEDIQNIKTNYQGDPKLDNKITLNSTDFSINWEKNIPHGEYKVQWLIEYRNIKKLSPEITFFVGEVANKYMRLIPGGSKGNQFWFSEHFFTKPSNIYNPSLAAATIASLCSADTCDEGELSENGDKYIKDLVVDRLQFENYEQIGYNTLTTKESIGATIACNTYPDNYFNDDYHDKTTLIYLPIRSCSYKNEWADNMFVGNGSDTRTVTSLDGNKYTFKTLNKNHSGFDLSAQNVICFLNCYIKKYKIDGRIKLWITGYSRGGAVANLTSAILNRAIYENKLESFLGNGNYILNKDDIYTYTAAAPSGANVNQNPNPRSNIYNNIFNIIDPNDIVNLLIQILMQILKKEKNSWKILNLMMML